MSNWIVILGCTVVFALVGWYVAFSKPDVFTATAQIVVSPLSEGDRPSDFATVYRTLLESDRVLHKMNQRLIEQGVLPEGTQASGEGLSAQLELVGGRGEPTSIAVLTLTSRASTGEEATARVNAWAEVFVEESRSMLRGSGREIESVLEEDLAEVRSALKEAETERDEVAGHFDQAKLKLEDDWEARLGSARASFDAALQDFREQTLEDLEELLEGHLAELGKGMPAGNRIWQSRLTELVHVYWRMAMTPRVLTLNKAPPYESLSEVLPEGTLESFAAISVESEEANPLYEFYAQEAVRRTSLLKLEYGDDWNAVFDLLIDLEALAFQRSETLQAKHHQHRRSLDAMQREQAVEVQALTRDRASELRLIGRRIRDLADQGERLGRQVNSIRIEGLLDESEFVDIASRASVPRSESRRLGVVTAAWTFMGLFFGLAVALVISFHSLTSRESPSAEE